MRNNYDFSCGVRAKYFKRFQAGTNLAMIESDLAKIFPDSESVNYALRSLVNAVGRKARHSGKPTPRASRRSK
jgi:hypothetical protein